MRRSKANNKKKNVTRRRKEKNSQFEKVTTRGASHHQRVSLNTNNNNKRWEGTVSRGPQRGGKENGQRSLTSFQQKKNLWECSTATVKRSSSWEKVFLFFLSYYIIARDHLCDPWMESKMPNFPPTEAAAADTSFRPFKKKKMIICISLITRYTRNRAAWKGAERLAIDMPRYIPLLMVRRSTRKGRPHNTACLNYHLRLARLLFNSDDGLLSFFFFWPSRARHPSSICPVCFVNYLGRKSLCCCRPLLNASPAQQSPPSLFSNWWRNMLLTRNTQYKIGELN